MRLLHHKERFRSSVYVKRVVLLLPMLFCSIGMFSQAGQGSREIARMGSRARFLAVSSHGKWGLEITGAGKASAVQPEPAAVEFYSPSGLIEKRSSGYDRIETGAGTMTGKALIPGPHGSSFLFEDRWTVAEEVVSLKRTVTVQGTSDGGFLSVVTFSHLETSARSAVDYFAPGVIYGSTDHLSAEAIGGRSTYGPMGRGEVQIREDRLPAPLFGVHFDDGSALTVLDPAPQGATTREDSRDTAAQTLIDARFTFGAVGVHLADGQQEQGYWFPGSEGEVTYRGDTYPGGQLHQWRRRYHPIRDGFAQNYSVAFRISGSEDFPAYYRNAWRWAFAVLKPPVDWQNIPLIERSVVDLLASQVETVGDRTGIANFVTDAAVPKERFEHAIMGFTGKNLEAAELLLADAQSDSDRTRSARDRELGLAIIGSFIKLRMNPPVGEGFDLKTGEPKLAIDNDHRVYLRSFGDDMKATLRASRREKEHGFAHADWLAWTRGFADWLLTQQQPAGGFPRAWKPVSGEVVDPSPASSYNPIPFLVLLSQETGDKRYLGAALRAGEFAWSGSGQAKGQFAGGTIDNPDVLDKEAGTLSNEAYLALFAATRDRKWLSRASAAADYAETYIYLWNVPMPADEDDAQLHWKKGVPTCGTQLIATGHSLVDDYMAFDVDEFARLSAWTGDGHYSDVARLLLHDTKEMVAILGRPYDLRGPGWQQEHWSFAPVRGYGLHRSWLPWVATSQLKGIVGLKEFDPALYKEFTAPPAKGAN
jgi:hypothetical protein